MPVQPTRIPILILKEVTSELNSLGIDILSNDFIRGTMKSSRESIAFVYCDVLVEIIEDAAMQLLADIVFLEIALSGQKEGEFQDIREKLSEKVYFYLNSLMLVYWGSSGEAHYFVEDLLESEPFVVWDTRFIRIG